MSQKEYIFRPHINKAISRFLPTVQTHVHSIRKKGAVTFEIKKNVHASERSPHPTTTIKIEHDKQSQV